MRLGGVKPGSMARSMPSQKVSTFNWLSQVIGHWGIMMVFVTAGCACGAPQWQFLHFATTDTVPAPDPRNAVFHGAAAIRPQTTTADSRRAWRRSGYSPRRVDGGGSVQGGRRLAGFTAMAPDRGRERLVTASSVPSSASRGRGIRSCWRR
jgi:hypothetical protein